MTQVNLRNYQLLDQIKLQKVPLFDHELDESRLRDLIVKNTMYMHIFAVIVRQLTGTVVQSSKESREFIF